MKPDLRDQDMSSGQNIPAYSSSVTNSEPENQIPVLNGVRAIACIIVLSTNLNLFARHYSIWPPLPNDGKLNIFFVLNEYLGDYFGDSGIILFFLLSGFLLFLPYTKALLFDSPWPSLRRFYLRRIFRMLPAYYAALLLIALFFHSEFLRSSHWHDLWLFLTFRMDYHLSAKLNPSFWTLAVGFQFYLLLPILAWLFRPIVRRGTVGWRTAKLTFCLFIITAWGLLTRYWGLFIANTPKLDFLIPHPVSTALKPYLYADTGKYFEVFAVGMLMCMVYTYTQNAPLAEHCRIRMRRLSWSMFIVGLVVLTFLSCCNLYFVSITSQYKEFHIIMKTPLDAYASIMYLYWLESQTLAYTIGYSFCFWALLYGSDKLKRPFEWPVLRWIASISFSLYLWHFPFMSLFVSAINSNIWRQGGGPVARYGAFWCWTLFVIIPISVMLYRRIELPSMRLGVWLSGTRISSR